MEIHDNVSSLTHKKAKVTLIYTNSLKYCVVGMSVVTCDGVAVMVYLYGVVVMVYLSSIQEGLTSLHIACNKGMLQTVRLIREKGEGQKRFNLRKKKVKLNSDFEVLINAKAAKFVCVYMLMITGVDSIHPLNVL